ncbi:uncharacterized protein LOC115051342 [Echeneis naucrates]|uniref:uncharacterized protein LOC115051342 n=1 Tax=Echeneis naucrates TaxID=173247 RepID=UPI00111425CF|nr:uncharacterized protein LOC115051342 [Echeneis naucrates]
MLELNKQRTDTTVLVDEILHSIFFLGAISYPHFTPEMIVGEKVNPLKSNFPRPFDLYSSQVPKRCPISCLLDMVVKVTGQQNETEIICKMHDILDKLERENNEKTLISSTICVSQKKNEPTSVRYYGVSMSTSGRNPGKIMVAASCLFAWDSHVGDAVMTYILKEFDNTKSKKAKESETSSFDGTIKVAKHLECQAYNITRKEKMPPCKACAELFGLVTNEKNGWDYGNCAEVGSISNLLKNEVEVKNQISTAPNGQPDEIRKEVIGKITAHLKNLLKTVKFKEWNGGVYTPSERNS